MKKIKFYCVTNKLINFISNENYNLAWVGKDNPPNNYIKCDNKDNIFYKEKNYSELTFHYWYWKNLLKFEQEGQWIGFCQKRRYWIKDTNKNEINMNNLNKYLLTHCDDKNENYEAFICDPIKISEAKKIKLLKRGWRNILKQPNIYLIVNLLILKFISICIMVMEI